MCYFINMSNVNLGQFLNNYANNFSRVNQNTVQNNVINNEQTMTSSQNNIMQTLLPGTTAQLNRTAAELALLNQQQAINMIKDLLQLPKSFEQLLSQLTVNAQNLQQNTALMLLASTMNLSQLSSLLQMNSKEAMTNLYQMLAQYNQLGISMKEEQLSELSRLISFVSAASSSDVQSLKTLMLMYLPWLPLTDSNAFKLRMDADNTSNDDISDDFITILIGTENYGNIQAVVAKNKQDGIIIEFISSETFPQKDFVDLMKEESRKYGININYDLQKKAVFNKEKNENPQIHVCMNTSPKVNPFLLLISNSLIKNVHNIDKKENLRENRKEKINNGEN